MRIGVIGVQGAVTEHIESVRKASARLGLKGESTTLSKLMNEQRT